MEVLKQLSKSFQRATIQCQTNQPQPPIPLPPSAPHTKAVRFCQHPCVEIPRVTTVPTLEHVPKVPTAPKEATMPPSHVLPGTKIVPKAAELPHLSPHDLQPPTPGSTPPPTNVVAQPQPLLPKTPSTRPPLRRSIRTPLPQPNNSALSRPPHIIPPDTPR